MLILTLLNTTDSNTGAAPSSRQTRRVGRVVHSSPLSFWVAALALLGQLLIGLHTGAHEQDHGHEDDAHECVICLLHTHSPDEAPQVTAAPATRHTGDLSSPTIDTGTGWFSAQRRSPSTPRAPPR